MKIPYGLCEPFYTFIFEPINGVPKMQVGLIHVTLSPTPIKKWYALASNRMINIHFTPNLFYIFGLCKHFRAPNPQGVREGTMGN